jgi:hypothetical protein
MGLIYVCPSQAMTASLSSLDVGEESTVTAREERAGSSASDMASVARAVSERITPAENDIAGSQGLVVAFDDQEAAPSVRGLPHLKALPCLFELLRLFRDETVVA